MNREVYMGTVRSFRDLIAWQKSMALAQMVYRDTSAMPADERYGLTNQMRRAAVSIPSNIAEGLGRQSRPDYIKHLRIARGSLMELDTQYELAVSLSMIRAETSTLEMIKEVDRILQGLVRSLEQKDKKP